MKRLCSIQDVCLVQQGGKQGLSGKNFVSKGFPAYGAGGMNGFLPSFEFDQQAIILSSIGARCGKCFYTEGKWSSLANVQLIFPDLEKVHPKYLWYQLNDEKRWPRHGTGQPYIRPSDVKEHQIYLPPMEEQTRIAAMLDKADELRRKRRESIAALDSLTQSIFLDLFGDPVTNPFGFKKTDLGSQLDFLTSGSRGWAQYYSDEGSLFLRIQNVCSGQLQLDDVAYVNAPDTAEAKRTLVQAGDVLLSITADLGRTAVVPSCIGPARINQHLAILRSSSINPTYLAQFLLTDAGQRQFGMLNKSAVKAGLNFSDIRSVKILLPPKELQEEFAKCCAAVQTQRTRLLAAQTETENLFTALQQKAFAP